MRYQNLPQNQESFRGAESTVPKMIQFALEAQEHLNVRQLAELICEGLVEKDYLSEMAAIYNYICNNCRYMRDPRTKELVKKPHIIVDQISRGSRPQIDCDELTCVIAALLLATGASCRIVTVAFNNLMHNGERQFTHVFLQAFDPKAKVWITLDPVAGEKTPKMMSEIKFAKVWPVA